MQHRQDSSMIERYESAIYFVQFLLSKLQKSDDIATGSCKSQQRYHPRNGAVLNVAIQKSLWNGPVKSRIAFLV